MREQIKIIRCHPVPNDKEGRYETGQAFMYTDGWRIVSITPTNEFGNYSEFIFNSKFDTEEEAEVSALIFEEQGEISENDWTCISTRNEIPDYVLYPDRPEFN